MDAIRAQRPEARTHAQKSYDALFEPGRPGRRHARPSASRSPASSIGLHGEAETAAFYSEGLSSGPLRAAVEAAIRQSETRRAPTAPSRPAR
jgi:hypothetical protein